MLVHPPRQERTVGASRCVGKWIFRRASLICSWRGTASADGPFDVLKCIVIALVSGRRGAATNRNLDPFPSLTPVEAESVRLRPRVDLAKSSSIFLASAVPSRRRRPANRGTVP